MPLFQIRPAILADAAAIAAVRHLCWQQTYRGIISESYLNQMNVEEAIELWKKIIPGHTGFVAVMETETKDIVGFVSGGKNRSGEANCEGEIYALYLLKSYHNQGLGKRLFAYGVNRLSDFGFKSFCLFVLKENPTVQFYKKFNPDLSGNEQVKIGEQYYDELCLGWGDINKFRA